MMYEAATADAIGVVSLLLAGLLLLRLGWQSLPRNRRKDQTRRQRADQVVAHVMGDTATPIDSLELDANTHRRVLEQLWRRIHEELQASHRAIQTDEKARHIALAKLAKEQYRSFGGTREL